MPADSDQDRGPGPGAAFERGQRLAELSSLTELSPTGCLVVEGEVIRDANAPAVEAMGIPRHRLVGVPLAELVLPEFEDRCRALLTTERAHHEVARQTVRLARGLAPVELAVRVVGRQLTLVGVRSMADEHHFSAQAGGHLTHDPVTGFPNRYHTLAQLAERLRTPSQKPQALLGLWVDELPTLVGAVGERAVQRVVRDVGHRLQICLRAPDLLGRFDDAGFLVVMSTEADPGQLTEIADRLREEVAFPVELDDRLVSFTASVVVGAMTERCPSVERILALLEGAAHRAVTGGGNRTDVLSI